MQLANFIIINYYPVYSSFINLDSTEWTNMICLFLNKLAEKPVGKLLSDKLIEFINSGYKITIKNCDFPHNVTIYPKIKFIDKQNILIVIPSVPYFTSIDTIDTSLCKDINNSFFKNLLNVTKYNPSKYKLDLSNYTFLLSKDKQSGFINLAHELIHCLRFWQGIIFDDTIEEDDTIYGIIGSVLSYNLNNKVIYITENTIRQEWGMKPRVSHDCTELFCMYDQRTHNNAHLFAKADYFVCTYMQTQSQSIIR